MTARLPTLLLCAAVVAGGCGGGDAQPSGREEFVRAADANCADRKRLFDEASADGTLSPEMSQEVFEREDAAQRALDPPAEMEQDWGRYLELLRGSAAAERELNTPPEESVDEEDPASGRIYRLGAQARALAREMGLEECAEPF